MDSWLSNMAWLQYEGGCSEWDAPDGPWAENKTSQHILRLSLEISRPQVQISFFKIDFCSASVLVFLSFFLLTFFSYLHSVLFSFFFFYFPPLFLSRGLRRNATVQEGILHPSWMWLCQAIYRWLLINPRPALMSSQLVLSFLSQTLLHAQGCFAYRQMIADVSGKC